MYAVTPNKTRVAGRRGTSAGRGRLAARCGVLLAAVALLLPAAARARGVTAREARRVAEHWVMRSPVFRSAARDLATGESFRVGKVTRFQLAPGACPAYRVDLLPRGYLVVSADRRLSPVLCFSATGDLHLEDVPPNALRAMLLNDLTAARRVLYRPDGSRSELQTVEALPSAAPRNEARWAALLAAPARVPAAPPDTGIDTLLVEPLLETTWSQWRHYNSFYPADPDPGLGYDGKAPVGCVPVAGSQVARYHEWPPRGWGAHTDVDSNHANLISGSFAAGLSDAFDWPNMKPSYNPWQTEPAHEVNAVAELMYEIGVAVDIDFGSFASGGSSSILILLGTALNQHLFYEAGTYLERDENPASFDGVLRQEILAHRPVPAGLPGHSVVVDGLSDEGGEDYFHINCGWGGQNDGWYRLSDIGGESLEDAIPGTQPKFMPLLEPPASPTNVTGTFTLAWKFPQRRAGSVTGYRLREGRLVATNFFDCADHFGRWDNASSRWELRSPGADESGTCFHIPGQYGVFRLSLRDPIRPAADTRLDYQYKAILVDDRLQVQVSADRGHTWIVLRSFTDTGWDPDWHSDSLSLAAYAGREILVRFEYRFMGGMYYGENGAAWLDDISLNHVQTPAWRIVSDTIGPGASSFTLSNRLDNLYYYALEASDGSAWREASPFASRRVALDPDLDLDGDGIPNGWESVHFGSATGAVADADSDADGSDNGSEYWAGTHPWDENSVFTILHCALETNGPALWWPAVTGRTYAVWRTTNLASPFVLLATNLPATPGTNFYLDSTAPDLGSLFYRVTVEIP